MCTVRLVEVSRVEDSGERSGWQLVVTDEVVAWLTGSLLINLTYFTTK